jgi:hypothetical protein
MNSQIFLAVFFIYSFNISKNSLTLNGIFEILERFDINFVYKTVKHFYINIFHCIIYKTAYY